MTLRLWRDALAFAKSICIENMLERCQFFYFDYAFGGQIADLHMSDGSDRFRRMRGVKLRGCHGWA